MKANGFLDSGDVDYGLARISMPGVFYQWRFIGDMVASGDESNIVGDLVILLLVGRHDGEGAPRYPNRNLVNYNLKIINKT